MKKVKEFSIFFLFLIFGLFIFFNPMFKTNFDLMPGWNVDTRLITYILEHSWLWITKTSITNSLWDMPFMYPMTNTLAISDTFIGIMPFYWFIKLFVKNPFSCLQILYVLFSVFNYSTFYYLLRKQFNFSNFASCTGAFVFAFSLMRYYRLGHFQFFTQFYSVLSLIFLIKTFKTPNKKILNFGLFSLFIVLQFYSTYFFGFYFVFVLFFVVTFLLFFGEYRKIIFEYFKINIKYVLIFGFIGLLSLFPLASHYLMLGQIRTLSEIVDHAANQTVWLNSASILDSFILKFNLPKTLLINEYACGVGIITMLFSFVGLCLFKKYSKIYYFILSFVFLNSCIIFNVFIWTIFYYIFPGAVGVRCVVRISFVALIVFAVGIAKLIDFIKLKTHLKTLLVLFFIVFLILAEHIPFRYDKTSNWSAFGWSKKEFISTIKSFDFVASNGCKVLYFEYVPIYSKNEKDFDYKLIRLKDEEDIAAMWIALNNKMYTLNGYNGLVKYADLDIKDEYCHVKSPYNLSSIK